MTWDCVSVRRHHDFTSLLCKPLGLEPEHLNENTCSFEVRLFSCFTADFILRSFIFTNIEIDILPNKKDFLHRDLLFLS